MQIQAEINAVEVDQNDIPHFSIAITSTDDSEGVAFETTIDASLCAFLVMRRDNRLPRDAFDKVVDAIESLNYSPMLAEELVGTVYESDEAA